jgi:hypothetical protein
MSIGKTITTIGAALAVASIAIGTAKAGVQPRAKTCADGRQGLPEPPWLEFREERRNVPMEPYIGATGRERNLDYGRRWFE